MRSILILLPEVVWRRKMFPQNCETMWMCASHRARAPSVRAAHYRYCIRRSWVAIALGVATVALKIDYAPTFLSAQQPFSPRKRICSYRVTETRYIHSRQTEYMKVE